MAAVIDDFSRIIYFENLPNKKAKTVAEFFIRAIKDFEKKWIKIKRLLSDNGKEFTTHRPNWKKNHVFERILQMYGIKHYCTRPHRPQTNWKIERFWRTFKEMFFWKNHFCSFHDFKEKSRDWLFRYNYKKPHSWIWGLSPMEKLFEYKIYFK